MAMFENFPYTNLHDLNLDWLVDQLNKMTEAQVLSVNGMTGVVTLYENAAVQFPTVAQDSWQILRLADGTTRGIYFANDNTAYILHGNTMSQIYSQNNQPPYPVTRVNGLYGDIELYTEQYVRLPDLTDAQMTNWTFFRILNGMSHGIQFNDDGTAQIIKGTSRYTIYTSDNPPPYPVSSVNGQTGAVILFTDSNAAIIYPAISDAGIEAWSMERNLNGTVLGLQLKDDGTLILKNGASEYTVYTSNDPMPGFVEDDTVEIMTVTEDSPDNFWGLIRETTEKPVGVVFENADPDDPHAYLIYTDSTDTSQSLQLMTTNDIPASGVVSVNTLSGIVTLYGSDIETASGDSRTLDTAVSDAEAKVAFIETSLVATRSYNVNSFIIVNNNLYRVASAISSGDTLTPGSNIIYNSNLGEQIRTVKNDITGLQQSKGNAWTAGSHATSTRVKCAGYLTSAGQNLHFFYPIAIASGLSVSSFTINSITARGIAGYILDTVSVFTGYTNSCFAVTNGLHFILAAPSPLGTNNTVATVEIDATVILA